MPPVSGLKRAARNRQHSLTSPSPSRHTKSRETTRPVCRHYHVMAANRLLEVHSLEIVVIVDNELDPISPSPNASIKVPSQMGTIAMNAPLDPAARGGAVAELRMDNICCSAHGLSLMIVRNRNPL